MKWKLTSYIVLATALFVGVLGSTHAQQAPIDASKLMSQIRHFAVGPIGTITGTGVIPANTIAPNTVAPATIVNGANYRHCYAAIWYTDQTYHYIFAYNTEGDVVYAYINAAYATSMMTSIQEICRSGHAYYAWYNSGYSPYSVYQIQMEF